MEGEEEEGQEPRRERKEELGATAAPREEPRKRSMLGA